MKDIIRNWWLNPAKWWQFWLPGSGGIGGILAGSAVSILIIAFMECVYG